MKNTTKVLMLCLILTGCATSYQEVGLSGGYSDTRLQDNVFTVNFRGNGYTSRERSSDFALLRCAELTIENGFKFFAVLDSSQEQKTMLYNTGSSSRTYGTTNIYGNTAYSNFRTYHSGSTAIPIIKPRSSYTIYCFAEKPDETIMAFDANYLSQSIRQKYNLKATSIQHIETSTGNEIKAVSRRQDIADQTDRLKSFLFHYCQAYESKDLNKFASFFTPDAIENTRAFHELLPRYRKSMEVIESFDYRIDLVSYSVDTNTGNISINGKFFTQYHLHEGAWKENSGKISMELIEDGDSYLVKRLNYSLQPDKKVEKQPQWGPWIEVKDKE